ncbi:MAG: Lrp/AsnC family transcriptional regulator [Pseudomonadota bacterium]
MDRIDRNILTLLQKDASISNNDLADLVGLAPSSCLRRVRQLKKDGVITKVIALTDPKKMNRPLKAIVTVKLTDHGVAARRDWLKEMECEPAISQVYSVSGETDTVIMMNLTDMEEFQGLSQRLFAEDDNVLQYQSLFVLEQHKFDLAL